MIPVGRENIVETSKGITGWLLTVLPTWITGITTFLTLVSSILGIVLLFFSIKSMYFTYKLNKAKALKSAKEIEEQTNN